MVSYPELEIEYTMEVIDADSTTWIRIRLWTSLVAEEPLQATSTIVVATGIMNVWSRIRTSWAAFHGLEERFPGRFLMGVGAGHRESNQTNYDKPYPAVKDYLDRLDAADVPPERRILSALGNDMLRLPGRRSLSAHPYLTTPSHSRKARDLPGPNPLLAPEQKVVLGSDPRTMHGGGQADQRKRESMSSWRLPSSRRE